MNVYVAAKWEERERAREIMYEIVHAGHHITHDWTLNSAFAATAAKADVNGVIAADAIVAIVEKDLPWKGMWVEIGIGIGYGKSIFMLGTFGANCIFTTLPTVHRIGTIAEVVEALNYHQKEFPRADTPL